MTTARRLIVNADDLGRTPGINRGIFEAHDRGLVTSATVMVNYPAAESVAEESGDLPDLGIGLHLQFSGGRPLAPPESIPSLVDENGLFPTWPEGLTGVDPREIRTEMTAQFDRFLDLFGRLPTHLDSHHHSHRNPAICRALVELARRHDLPIRNASDSIERRVREAGLPTNDHFVERFFDQEARLDVLIEIIDCLTPGVTEIMCHPADVDDELRSTSSYAEQRQRELEVLTHPDAAKAVLDRDVRLVNFSTAWRS